MNEELKQRLYQAAQRRAFQVNLKLSPQANNWLENFIDQGVDKMTPLDLRTKSRLDLAETNIVTLVENVASGRIDLSESVGDRTFSEARMRLCPLWPFC